MDPTGSIIQEMVGAGDAGPGADVAIQIMFRPEDRTWTDGVPNGQGVGDLDAGNALGGSTPSLRDLAHQLRQPTLEEHRRLFTWETIEHPPSAVDKKVAKLLERQRGDKGWHLCLRVFAASPDPDEAVRRASKTAGMFRNFYQHESEQTFVPQPLQGDDLRAALVDAAAREWEPTGIVKSQREVAGLVNVPKAEFVNTTDMKWALSSPGRGVPPGTPRFDFAAAGVAHASDAERQVAMLDHDDPTAPLWYGRGSRDGTEAGVFPDVLNTHQFVGGATGQGKTTLLKNLTRQLLNRGHGVLFYDPKGMDAADLVSLVPDHREADLIYLDVGGDRDRSVGFNFLEPPTDAPPDSQVFVDAIESMTDDIAALLEQSSGDQDYWGPRMDQICRNLVRGMARAGHQCTLLDMYLVLLDEQGREEYARMLRDDRLDWLRTYAERELTDMSQDDIRPILGRLKELVENRTTREIISHPESTASIRDAVRDGRIIVVRDMSSQDNAGRMVATALIRRIWVAVRELTMAADQADPPDFYAILDEFNDIAAASSNIDTILSNARSFGLSITAACQDLSAQLDDDILNAIEGQCQTFLSFNPGRSGDATIIAKQHSPDVDDEDLLNLSKYRLYMRTHDRNEELTHSYKIDAFPPLDDVGDVARSEAAVERLIERSLERYGAPRRSSADVKADSVFYDAGPDATADPGAAENAAIPATRVLEATWVAQVRAADAPGETGRAPLSAVERELARRLGGDPSDGALSNAVERALFGSDVADVERQRGTVTARLTDAGEAELFAQDTGSDQRGGGVDHRHLLRRAHGALTRLGFVVRLPAQDAPDLPDGIVDLPIDPMDGETLDEVQERRDDLQEYYPGVWVLTRGKPANLEAETSTIGKPSRTLANLRKAVNAGRVCIFAVPDGRDDGGELDYWVRRGETIFRAGENDELAFVRERTAGDRRFYNTKRKLAVGDGAVALRPAPEDGGRTPPVEWVAEAGDDGDLVCRDGHTGGVIVRLDGVDALADPPASAFPAYREIDDTDGSRRVWTGGQELRYGSQKDLDADWRPIRAPFVPEREFDREPTADDFVFVVFPDADNPQYDRPQVYEDGTLRPLAPGIEAGDPPSSAPSEDEVGSESDEAAFLRAVSTLAHEAVDDPADPDWAGVTVAYTDIAERAQRDLTPTRVGQLRAALDLGKAHRETGSVVTDADLGTKLRRLCDEHGLAWPPAAAREADYGGKAG